MGVHPKKISIFFPEIFCQRIDRKSQEFSATYVKPLGHDRHRKKVRVKLTPPPVRDRVKKVSATFPILEVKTYFDTQFYHILLISLMSLQNIVLIT